jgi:hypothetical protein
MSGSKVLPFEDRKEPALSEVEGVGAAPLGVR